MAVEHKKQKAVAPPTTKLALPHVKWLVNTGTTIVTNDGVKVELWEFRHEPDDAVLSQWAKHFREHYCKDRPRDRFAERWYRPVARSLDRATTDLGCVK